MLFSPLMMSLGLWLIRFCLSKYYLVYTIPSSVRQGTIIYWDNLHLHGHDGQCGISFSNTAITKADECSTKCSSNGKMQEIYGNELKLNGVCRQSCSDLDHILTNTWSYNLLQMYEQLRYCIWVVSSYLSPLND